MGLFTLIDQGPPFICRTSKGRSAALLHIAFSHQKSTAMSVMFPLIIGNNDGPIKDGLYQFHKIRGFLFHIKILPPFDGFMKERMIEGIQKAQA